MTLRLDIAPRAFAEAAAAAEVYESSRPGHGMQFRREVDHVLAMIQDHPDLYQKLDARCRRAFLRRFPFVVVYRVTRWAIQVLAVMPTHSDPTAITQRAGVSAS